MHLLLCRALNPRSLSFSCVPPTPSALLSAPTAPHLSPMSPRVARTSHSACKLPWARASRLQAIVVMTFWGTCTAFFRYVSLRPPPCILHPASWVCACASLSLPALPGDVHHRVWQHQLWTAGPRARLRHPPHQGRDNVSAPCDAKAVVPFSHVLCSPLTHES